VTEDWEHPPPEVGWTSETASAGMTLDFFEPPTNVELQEKSWDPVAKLLRLTHRT
jgi:hypothetical protein